MYPKIAILICHLPERASQLGTLLAKLNAQKTDDVEIVVNDDKYPTIGDKRNAMLDQADALCAEYVCFVDDDDDVSDDYIPLILKAIGERPDIVGFKADKYVAGEFHSRYAMSFVAPSEGGITRSVPMHLNPTLLEHAMAVRFKPLNRGEDLIYAGRLASRLKRESFIGAVLYRYNYDPTKDRLPGALASQLQGA
jgi:glycosyltransferase involved in cell wall biosynthesis